MASATPKKTTGRTNTYQVRKKTVDVAAAQLIFDRSFALDAFLCGYSAGRGKARPTKLTAAIVSQIDKHGHAKLARICLAYLLGHENAHEGLDNSAYLSCLRDIRDGAKKIAQAADELVNQILRHQIETGELEMVRARTFHRLASALHGRFRAEVDDDRFAELIYPKLIGNRFSDLRTTHGLSSLAALNEEAEEIRKLHVRNQKEVQRLGGANNGLRTGNKVNKERKDFVLDLAALYEQIFRIAPTASTTAPDQISPFLRFVYRVFAEFSQQSIAPVDHRAYLTPSFGTVRGILKDR